MYFSLIVYDTAPQFPETSLTWIISVTALPQQHDANILIADVLAVSSFPGNISYNVMQLPALIQESNAIVIQDTRMSITERLTRILHQVSHPIQGVLRATDSRPLCHSPAGLIASGCYTDVPFILHIVDFNPGCPNAAYGFTLQSTATVSWNEPKLYRVDGVTLPMTATYEPENQFLLGWSTVTYTTSVSRTQNTRYRLSCSFVVRFHRNTMSSFFSELELTLHALVRCNFVGGNSQGCSRIGIECWSLCLECQVGNVRLYFGCKSRA
jgi:hypothetical protein